MASFVEEALFKTSEIFTSILYFGKERITIDDVITSVKIRVQVIGFLKKINKVKRFSSFNPIKFIHFI